MRFYFKFLLSNNRVERLAFTASTYQLAAAAAFSYSRTAFKSGELLDFYHNP